MKYVYSNLSKVFMLALFTPGFLCFLMYYGHIGYMPQLDLLSISSVVIIISLMAIVFTITIMGSLVFSGAAWSWWAYRIEAVKSRVFAEGTQEVERYRKLLRGISFYYLIPMVLYGISVMLFFSDWHYLGLCPLALWIGILAFKTKTSSENKKWQAFVAFLGLSVVAFVLILLPVAYVETLLIKENLNLKETAYADFLLFLLLLLEVNAFVIFNPEKWSPRYGLPAAALLMFGILLTLFHAYSAIPAQIMKLYKIGNVEPEVVAFRNEGCKIFESLGFGDLILKDANGCSAKNLKILSAIGQEWYLQFNNSGLKFVMPREYVMSPGFKDS